MGQRERVMFGRVKGWMADADSWVAREAASRTDAARTRGIDRNKQSIMDGRSEEVANTISAQMRYPKDEPNGQSKLREELLRRMGNSTVPPLSSDASARQAIADEFGPQMNRGSAQLGWGRESLADGGQGARMGFREAVNSGIANNEYVRRGLLPTAIVGGAAFTGAGLTATAQNLVALGDYIRQGQSTQQRTEQSPLS